MSESVEFAASLLGAGDLDETFKMLTGSQQRDALRKAMRAAGAVLIKETKQRVPDRKTRGKGETISGLGWTKTKRGKLQGLKRSMMQIPSGSWKDAAAMRKKGIIATRVGFKKRTGSHAHLVEFGHDIITKTGGKPKTGSSRARPQPFFRPAMDASGGRMKTAIRAKLIQFLAKLKTKSKNKRRKGRFTAKTPAKDKS